MREYNIDLVEEADNITWRKFQVLLKSLSADSAVSRAVRQDGEENKPIEDNAGYVLNRFG